METLIMEAVPSFKHEAGRDSWLVCVLSYGLICRRVGQKKERQSVAIECSKCCVTYFAYNSLLILFYSLKGQFLLAPLMKMRYGGRDKIVCPRIQS